MKYIGIKEVEATPMTAKEAAKKGYRVSNNAKEDGYEVTYKDGYKSWSPKEVFDEAYRHSEEYQYELIEDSEFWEKDCKELFNFIRNDDKFKDLPEKTKNLLEYHYGHTLRYVNILRERRSKFSENG